MTFSTEEIFNAIHQKLPTVTAMMEFRKMLALESIAARLELVVALLENPPYTVAFTKVEEAPDGGLHGTYETPVRIGPALQHRRRAVEPKMP